MADTPRPDDSMVESFELQRLDFDLREDRMPSERPDKGFLKNGGCVSMLGVLYDVAASINVTHDVNEVLLRFLHTLTDIIGARAGAVRLVGADGDLHLVASVGMDDDLVEREKVMPSLVCACGSVEEPEKVVFLSSISGCAKAVGRDFFDDMRDVCLIVVPLRHRANHLGVYNLYVDASLCEELRQYEELFTSIGRFLGMAIVKARLDEETHRLSLMEERSLLANELHDSLAQTLASVRFQVRVLDETLHEGNEAFLWQVLEKIENSLDEANAELRELIAHFRAPLDSQGVISGVERAVVRFRRRSDIQIFLQKDWPERKLPAEYELQIVRIVQESLANIAKHSQAKTVRVLLRGDKSGEYRILIEDDGIGLSFKEGQSGSPGDHIGLSIMRDRARRIGGELTIESEPGEGTRVLLKFHLPVEKLPVDIRP